jgi:hypothetical protein
MHIFAFLKKKPKLSIYLDPSLPNIDYGDFRTKRKDFADQLLKGVKTARDSTRSVEKRVGFVTNLVAPPLAIAPAVAAAARAIARRLIGRSKS